MFAQTERAASIRVCHGRVKRSIGENTPSDVRQCAGWSI